jgi:hypothetical protein
MLESTSASRRIPFDGASTKIAFDTAAASRSPASRGRSARQISSSPDAGGAPLQWPGHASPALVSPRYHEFQVNVVRFDEAVGLEGLLGRLPPQPLRRRRGCSATVGRGGNRSVRPATVPASPTMTFCRPAMWRSSSPAGTVEIVDRIVDASSSIHTNAFEPIWGRPRRR